MTDGRGDTSYYTYDAAGNMASFTNPLGEVKRFEYTLLGQIKKITKPDEKEITYRYDQYNRLNSILYQGGDTVSYEYDGMNRRIGMIDPNGVSNYEYDGMDRLTTYIDPADEEVNYEYDEKGRKSKIVYPDGKYVSYAYDEHDRLVTVTDREGRETTYTYDEAGRRKTTKYPNGITTTYEYDQKNRITEIDSVAENGTTVERIRYEYDGAGNKTEEEIWKEDKHYLRSYEYYKNNTIKSMEETGDNNVEYSYVYDEAGNITEKTVTEDGETTQYTYDYDEANRMLSEAENGITTRTYKYDLNGNRVQRILSDETEEAAAEGSTLQAEEQAAAPEEEAAVSSNGSAKGKGKGNSKKNAAKNTAAEEGEEADAEEAVEEAGETEGTEADEEERVAERQTADYFYYDDADQLVEIVEHSGKVYTYGYDGDGNRLWRTFSQSTAVKPPVEEGEHLQVPPGKEKEKGKDKEKNKGNGQDKDNEKDKPERGPKKEKLSWNDDAEGVLLAYSRTGLMDLSMLLAYDKDNGKGGGKDKDNGKDKDKENGKDKEKDNGNGKDKGSNGDKDKVKGNDKTDKQNNGNGNGKEKIKERGRGKDKIHNNRGKHLGWYKRANHPHYPGGGSGGEDDLTKPEVFEVTNYINDISEENEQVLMTTDIDGNYRGVYTYGIERISAEDLGSIEGRPNDPLYYLYDAIGTATSITNMNAGIIDSNRFAPYGEPLDPVAKNARLTNSPFGFTGEMHDIEARLVYLRARYYEPGTMRFLQQDTMFGEIREPLTRNLYIYGNANPLTYVDPSGHFVRVVNDERKVLITKFLGEYIDKDLLNNEGILHFKENSIDDVLRSTDIYKNSIDEEYNYIYTIDSEGNYINKKYDDEDYQNDRESRLYFLKHFARIQAKIKYKDPEYIKSINEIEEYSDADTFRKIADYAVKLNKSIANSFWERGYILDDLLLTIGSSKYSISKLEHPDEFLKEDQKNGPLRKGDSKFQLGLRSFGQIGFNPILQEQFENDPDPNNVQHHLLAIYLGYWYGRLAYLPGMKHEYIDKGGTDADMESTKRGIELGLRLLWGKDSMEDLGDLIYYNVTSDSIKYKLHFFEF